MLSEVPATRIDGQIFHKGFKWANPIETDAKRRMKKFQESPSMPQQWAKDLQIKIKENFSFDAVSKIFSRVLEPHLKDD